MKNCPVFVECGRFTLRGTREDVEDRSGRVSRGGWQPIRTVLAAEVVQGDEVNGSTIDGVWLQAQVAEDLGKEGKASLCGVEEYVRRHLTASGWAGSSHCENRLFLTLFGLLFWDVLHHQVQTPPPPPRARVLAHAALNPMAPWAAAAATCALCRCRQLRSGRHVGGTGVHLRLPGQPARPVLRWVPAAQGGENTLPFLVWPLPFLVWSLPFLSLPLLDISLPLLDISLPLLDI